MCYLPLPHQSGIPRVVTIPVKIQIDAGDKTFRPSTMASPIQRVLTQDTDSDASSEFGNRGDLKVLTIFEDDNDSERSVPSSTPRRANTKKSARPPPAPKATKSSDDQDYWSLPEALRSSTMAEF